jgi:hypothetical protein
LPRSAPATYCTSGNSLRIASTSPSLRVKKLLELMRTPPPPRPAPGDTSRRLEPRPDTILSISACVPCPTDTITITAAMPMITPSEVSALRIQLPRSEKIAVRRMSAKVIRPLLARACLHHASGRRA